MAYFVALDGGGTKTECWVADEARVLGQASGPTVKIMNVGERTATENLRAIVRDVPLDRLLVETDSPYLAPVPYRGKRNEPAYVAATAAAVAALKGVDPNELAAATTANFFRLFAKARPPVAAPPAR